MSNIKSLITRFFEHQKEKYGLRSSTATFILILPLAVVLIFIVFVAIRGTRSFAFLMVEENYPVELITFHFLLFGSIQSFILALNNRKMKGDLIIFLFYLIFSFGLFFVGMEEISWGQQFMKFKTPEFILSDNRQYELTLHNLGGLQGWSEIFHILFALGGLIGLSLSFKSRFREIRVPLILITYFVPILIFASLDLYNDFYRFSSWGINKGVKEMSEVLEMLIGISGFLYAWLIKRRMENT